VTDDVLVAGIGNLFLGDDGFGPEVVRHLAALGQPSLPEDVRLVDYGIRGVHLCYDLLDGYEALIIVDAVPAGGRPGEVTVLAVGPQDVAAIDDGYDPHGMDPVAVLSGLPALGGALPPTYVVGVQPMDLEEGIGLSAPVRDAVPIAAEAVRGLLATRPWNALAGRNANHRASVGGKV
jgi:hydrogenase maturation protease